MLSLSPTVKIYLSRTPVDMRKGPDGLSALVRQDFAADVFSGHLFIFYGRRTDRLKILFWDRGGFVIYYKRLERGRFRLPPFRETDAAIELDRTQLALLLDGFSCAPQRAPRRWQPPLAPTAAHVYQLHRD